MKNRASKTLFVLAGTMMISAAALAQNRVVTGTVVDNFGDPVIGANVVIKGTTEGTMTDADGNFTLKNVPEKATLHVTYIGFAGQDVNTAGKSKFNVQLEEDSQTLDDVVVVGYGVQRKADVTGATARVNAKDLTAMPVKDALQGMQGKSAGVDIQNSQRPGEVGNIQIRGVRSLNASNAPLYVVDGMILQNGGIENINPQDIESIDILKDASSTAIYGSRGANGVVLVTTKKGKEGKVSINYAGTVSWEWLRDVADQMSAAEWLDYARMAKYNMGQYNSTIDENGKVVPVMSIDKGFWGTVAASWANIEKAYDSNGKYDRSKVGGFDWADEGKQTGISQEHNINVSGGTDKFNGYGSFGYLHQDGTQPGQEYERYTMKASFDAQPLKFFKMGVSMNAAYGKQDYGYSFTKSTTGAGDLYGALQGMLPWTVPFDENGEYLRNPNGDVNIINPIRELDYNTNQRSTFNIDANVYGQVDLGAIYKPLEGLTYRLQFGPGFKFHETNIFNNKNGINGDGNNNTTWNRDNYRSWTLDNIINYNRTFAKLHKVGVTLLQSANQYHHDVNNSSSKGVAMETELWYNMATGTYTLGTGLDETSMESYMGRVNYSFADKYLLTASVRWDGASQLAEGHKWATFPSVALGWRIDQESFMESTQDWLSQLKLRAGWGISGNSAISAYATKGAIQGLYYQYGSDVVLGYVGSDASAKTPNKAQNNELGWEKTQQTNIGIDYGFLNNRLTGSIDWYKTSTTDLLMAMSIPSLTGYTSTYANVGETSGWGLDFQLNAQAVKTRDFSWDIALTWSLDRSKIEALANGREEDINNGWFVGEEIGVFYDYVYDGVWKTGQTVKLADGTDADCTKYGRKTGQIKVKDLNGDGKIDAEDRKIVGKVRPDWSGGITNTFNYKQWELSCFIYARMGFDVKAGAANLDGRYMQRSINYFVAGHNENADYYAPGINGESADTYQGTQNYQDGSYIKVRNINLGYNFSPKQLKKAGISSLKVYAQCMNPFSIYRATDWLDTDLVSYANNTRTWGSTVTSTSFVFGVNVGF